MNRSILYLVLLFIVLFGGTGLGAVPSFNVVISDSAGKLAFKGATDANGRFTTSKLKRDSYTVQFTAAAQGAKGSQYAIVVSAGKARVTANVAGEKFAGPGVAMKLVTGEPMAETLKKNPGLNNPAAIRALERDSMEAITGQVTQNNK
jgi:hypothetical protein